MNRLFAVIARQLAGLVHPVASEPMEQARHAWFIATRLAMGAIGLGSIPIVLALHGGMSVLGLTVVTTLFVQALAALHASRTGALSLSQGVSLIASAVMVWACAVAGDGLLSPSLIMVPLLVLETSLLRHAIALRQTVLVGSATLTAVVLQTGVDFATAGVLAVHLAFIIVAAGLATISLREGEIRSSREHRLAAQNRLLIDGFGDLVTCHDSQGQVISAGPAARAVLGAAPSDLLGRGLFDRVHVADRPLFLLALSGAASNPGMTLATVRVRRAMPGEANDAPPQFVWLEIRARRLDHADHVGNEGPEIVCLMRDVTAQKRHESDLDASRAAAETATAMKDRFLAMVSHELRTPLNAIIGFSEMLSDERLVALDDPRRRDYARIIHMSGSHLLEVVNSLLDMSRLDAGTFPIEPEPFDARKLVESCVELMQIKVQQGGLRMETEIAGDMPALVADRRALKQVLINLIANAVKFTPMGGRIRVSAQRDAEIFVLSVEDSGIGIAAEDLSHIGQPFFQARGSYDRPYEGTGLGLSVVRGLVELHGGSIHLESAVGKGTRVTVRLSFDPRVRLTPILAGERSQLTTARLTTPMATTPIPANQPVKRSA